MQFSTFNAPASSYYYACVKTIRGSRCPLTPTKSSPKMVVTCLIVNLLFKSVCCAPPYQFPPVKRISMPNPMGSGEDCDSLMISGLIPVRTSEPVAGTLRESPSSFRPKSPSGCQVMNKSTDGCSSKTYGKTTQM